MWIMKTSSRMSEDKLINEYCLLGGTNLSNRFKPDNGGDHSLQLIETSMILNGLFNVSRVSVKYCAGRPMCVAVQILKANHLLSMPLDVVMENNLIRVVVLLVTSNWPR